MSDILTVGGIEYQIGKLDSIKAFHVSRHIAPLSPIFMQEVLAGLGKAIFGSTDSAVATAQDKLNDIAFFLGTCQPLLDKLDEMPDEKVEYVIHTCLSCVERHTDKIWSPVMRDGVLMFADIDMPQMLTLVVRVILKHIRPIGVFAGL